MKKIVFLLISLISFLTKGQNIQWTALSECGGQVIVQNAVTDSDGNVFVAGKFNGEAEFSSSAKGKVIRKYSGSSQSASFLACYSPSGELRFLYKLKGSEGFEIRAICIAPANSVLLFCYGAGRVVQEGAPNKENDANVFRIDSNGKIVMKKQIRNAATFEAESDPEGNIYFAPYDSHSYPSNKLLMYDSTLALKGTIDIGYAFVRKLSYKEGKLYGLIQNTPNQLGLYQSEHLKQSAGLSVPMNHLALCQLEFGKSHLNVLQSWEVPTYNDYARSIISFQPTLHFINGKMYAELFLRCPSTSYDFLGIKTKQEQGQSVVYRLGQGGYQKRSEFFKGGYSNSGIFPGNNADTYLVFSVYDSMKTANGISLIADRYSQFIYETAYAKLDSDLKFIWITKGGGNYDTSYHPFLLESKNGILFGVSNITDRGFEGKNKIITKWKSAYYVARISP